VKEISNGKMFLKNEFKRIELRLVVDVFMHPSSGTQTRDEVFGSLDEKDNEGDHPLV
jgi:hypothetical protein